MNQNYFIGFLFLTSCVLLEVSSRPNNNEETTHHIEDLTNTETPITNDKDGKALPFTDEVELQLTKSPDENTEDILSKIKAINDGLKKPFRRQQMKYNSYGQPYTGGGYTLDAETLDKLKQMIASGNPRIFPKIYDEPEEISDQYDEYMSKSRYDSSRALNYGQISPIISNNLLGNNGGATVVPLPYTVNIPVAIIPSLNNINGEYTPNSINSLESAMAYQTRQRPTLPFQIQWPLAPFFPILVKDPLLGLLHGGGWNNFIEYGQTADVCSRKQKSTDSQHEENVKNENQVEEKDIFRQFLNSREGRAIKKRTISSTPSVQQVQTSKKTKKFFTAKPLTTKKPVKETYNEEQHPKISDSDDGDLRTKFGDFPWFGHRKPAVPSPGFFINRLKVRRGGVAIAGPGGVATAGRGGTAIVGPGGLAYTQPGGLAVAGPAARVVALSSDADLHSIISRLQTQKAADGSVPRLLQSIPEGKVVATGPIVYYHPYPPHSFDKGAWRPIQRDFGRGFPEFSGRSHEKQFKSSSFSVDSIIKDFSVYLNPVAHAISSPRGVAIANPISQVVVGRDETGTIYHNPEAFAIVGPGGIAHAHATLQYLPFYGGAKGQYLEIKKDNSGATISEKIVSEENISSENVVKNSDENLLSKVLGANLQSLQSLSSSLLKLHNLGRKTGYLGSNEKASLKKKLASLGETASNTIKLIDEIGDNVDMLFKNQTNKVRNGMEEEEENVGEEGIGIDNPAYDEEVLGGATIAEAKPVGLAVIGENGLAASRPMATAIASHGIALARPIATAIAGVDPSVLGINFQINNAKH